VRARKLITNNLHKSTKNRNYISHFVKKTSMVFGYCAENKTKDNNDIDKNAEGCYHNKA
jgi:hypothetical protein